MKKIFPKLKKYLNLKTEILNQNFENWVFKNQYFENTNYDPKV